MSRYKCDHCGEIVNFRAGKSWKEGDPEDGHWVWRNDKSVKCPGTLVMIEENEMDSKLRCRDCDHRFNGILKPKSKGGNVCPSCKSSDIEKLTKKNESLESILKGTDPEKVLNESERYIVEPSKEEGKFDVIDTEDDSVVSTHDTEDEAITEYEELNGYDSDVDGGELEDEENPRSESEMEDYLSEILMERGFDVNTFSSAGILTNNRGLVVGRGNNQFQITIVDSSR